MIVQGYARKDNHDKVWLGFIDQAPIFQQVAADKMTEKLVQADDGDVIVGYSVTKKGEANGFLYYPNDLHLAEDLASFFSKEYNTPFDCIPLTIQS